MHVKNLSIEGYPTVRLRPGTSSLFAYSKWLRYLPLSLILLLSTFLNFFRLNQLGLGNDYYAAGIRSMLDSWHNFFFVSFDPGGFVTLDKPPLGFWIQAVSAKLFGFSGTSLLAPEALAGVISVALLYHLVARVFGTKTGLLAALALAVSPLSVVTSRNNTIDMLLVCTTLFATWAIFRATETGRLSWLAGAAAIVGIGFNIKALEAYLVVPAFGLLYLVSSQRRWRVRLLHLLAAAGVLLGVSFIWVTIVDLTPASQRPYVGSTADNSEVSLSFGYNGLRRLLGSGVGLGSFPLSFDDTKDANIIRVIETRVADNLPALVSFSQEDAQMQAATPQASNAEEESPTGEPGLFRLFEQPLNSQIAWLLPFALLGLLGSGWQARWRFPLTRQQQALLLWGTAFLTMGVFFSFAAVINAYYLVMFAPSICALAAIGMVAMWQDFRRHSWRAWLLPVALVLSAILQALYLSSYPGFASVLAPIIVTFCALVAISLAAAHLLSDETNSASVSHSRNMGRAGVPQWGSLIYYWLLRPVVVLAFLSLLIAPFVWGSYSVLNVSTIWDAPGPQPQMAFQVYVSGWNNMLIQDSLNDRPPNLSKLDRYLLQQRGQATFIVATLSSDLADAIILATNQPVMTLGGYSGNDPILTTQKLVNDINSRAVRFFLFRIPSKQTPNGQLVQWVNDHCGKVQAVQWANGDNLPGRTISSDNEELFDCAHYH